MNKEDTVLIVQNTIKEVMVNNLFNVINDKVLADIEMETAFKLAVAIDLEFIAEANFDSFGELNVVVELFYENEEMGTTISGCYDVIDHKVDDAILLWLNKDIAIEDLINIEKTDIVDKKNVAFNEAMKIL